MAKVKTFKTIFPAVSVPLNPDYSINEPEFRAYLRWIKSFYGKGIEGLVCNGHTGEITGLALLGAGFSSLLANTQRGMVLLGTGLNKDVSLESKFIRIGCLLCLAFAMVICYSYDGSPTQLILMANIATSIATPVGGLFILLLIWRKDVNEGYKSPTALRICMTISYIFALFMTGSALQGQLPKLMALFGL